MSAGKVLTQRSREAEGGTRSVVSLTSAASAVPPLRFKGFDAAWEEKKLGETVSFSKGKGYSKSDIREVGVPLFLYGRMYTDYQAEVSSVDTFCEPQESSVFSKGSEVVCPASGETAEDIARASAVCKGGIILGGDLNILTPKDQEQLYSSFLALTLSNGSPCREIQSRAQGKTVVHVHNSDLEDIVFAVPRSSEQRKIGAAFREIDALIAAREEALGKLEQFKKAMLEKMFPRMDVSHGGTETRRCRVPELRFKGFEGEWEDVPFDAMFERLPAKDCQIQSDEYLEIGKYPVVDQGKDAVIAYSDRADKVFRAKGKPVIVFGDHTREIKFVDFDFIIGADGTQLLRTIGQDISFGFYALTRIRLPNVGYSRHFKYLMESRFTIPSLSEQRKIGAYFRSLDALLAARREEIGKLKDLKKALLERMFV